jgi:hypothetical protein
VLDGPAEELQQGCCSYGAHLIDDDDVQIVVRAFVRVKPEQMQFHAKAVRGGFMRSGEPDSEGQPTTITRLVDDACIFLNRPGFAGGVGCALHIAALEAGERPLDWKPNVCWQVPIRLEHHTDDNGHVTSRLREWKRRDWGDGGNDFHGGAPSPPRRSSVGSRSTSRAATRSASSSGRTSTSSWWSSSSVPDGPRSPTPPSAAERSRIGAVERRRVSRRSLPRRRS